MEHDSESDAARAAMTTAEHTSLGNVLDVIRRLEELRTRGLSAAQIAERIRLTHPNRPGGGPWSPEAVERVLEIADANRPRPAAQPVGPEALRPPEPQYPIQPAPTSGVLPPSAAPPPSHRDGAPHLAQRGADAAHARTETHRAPLRVEPRRYHQRPPFDTDASDGDEQRRWPLAVGLLTLAALVAVGFGLRNGGTFDRFTSTVGPARTTTSEAADAEVVDGDTGSAEAADEDTADDAEPTAGSGEVSSDEVAGETTSDDADTMTIRIEPSTPQTDSGIAPATATIRTDGKLYIEGAFRSESEADRFLRSASQVFGAAALVRDYTIDPAAPDPTVSDVVLEKPVLFESGSAVIDPEYIPYLEACGDVLKLNSHIVMSVTAFTDASGDSELNLQLSQQRADAVIAFYRSLDIGDDQLVSAGFGESDFVADNTTEEGRQQNRRAMLELLNVMADG